MTYPFCRELQYCSKETNSIGQYYPPHRQHIVVLTLCAPTSFDPSLPIQKSFVAIEGILRLSFDSSLWTVLVGLTSTIFVLGAQC